MNRYDKSNQLTQSEIVQQEVEHMKYTRLRDFENKSIPNQIVNNFVDDVVNSNMSKQEKIDFMIKAFALLR